MTVCIKVMETKRSDQVQELLVASHPLESVVHVLVGGERDERWERDCEDDPGNSGFIRLFCVVNFRVCGREGMIWMASEVVANFIS